MIKKCLYSFIFYIVACQLLFAAEAASIEHLQKQHWLSFEDHSNPIIPAGDLKILDAYVHAHFECNPNLGRAGSFHQDQFYGALPPDDAPVVFLRRQAEVFLQQVYGPETRIMGMEVHAALFNWQSVQLCTPLTPKGRYKGKNGTIWHLDDWRMYQDTPRTMGNSGYDFLMFFVVADDGVTSIMEVAPVQHHPTKEKKQHLDFGTETHISYEGKSVVGVLPGHEKFIDTTPGKSYKAESKTGRGYLIDQLPTRTHHYNVHINRGLSTKTLKKSGGCHRTVLILRLITNRAPLY